jgi:toxin ParE1/3/4
MAEYVLTNKAVDDLSGIWDYTYEAWSEKQADKYYELLIKTCTEIAEKPGIGRSYRAISKEIFGYRIGKHIIFYRELNSEEVEIIRVLHGQMDLKDRVNE